LTRKLIVTDSGNSRAKPLVRGENILDRYVLDFGNQYIIYEPKELYNPLFREAFETPKILIRKISGKRGLMAVLDAKRFYAFSTLIIAIRYPDLAHVPRVQRHKFFSLDFREYELAYVLAVLNSAVLHFYFTTLLSDGLSVTPDQVNQLPIRRIAFATPADTRAVLLEKGQALLHICTDKGDQDCIIGFVEHQLDQKPERADVVHDLLAYLAEQMIDLHKERQHLEREADLFRFVERDTPCLPLDKALGGPLSAGEMVGDPSAIRHDIEGLRLTDDLIDQIVYKLYGLTEEEIAIVEGRS